MLMLHYTILILLTTPVLGWFNWYGATQYEIVNDNTRYEIITIDANTAANTPRQLHKPDIQLLPRKVNATQKGAAVDILKTLNLSLDTPGVAHVTGPILNAPAFKLRPTFGNVQVPNPLAVISALSNPDGFTLVFIYRQHRRTLGTLLSMHSPGRVTPWFQVASNFRTGQIILHYRLTTDAKMHQNAWSLKPVAQFTSDSHPNSVQAQHKRKPGGLGWTFVSISLNTTTNKLTMQLGCEPARVRSLSGRRHRRRPCESRGVGGTGGGRRGRRPAQPVNGPIPRINVPDDALVYFRQEPGLKKKFLGTIQVAKVYPYSTTEHKEWKCNGDVVVPELQ